MDMYDSGEFKAIAPDWRPSAAWPPQPRRGTHWWTIERMNRMKVELRETIVIENWTSVGGVLFALMWLGIMILALLALA